MPKEFHRSERVSELLHRLVSDVVRNEVNDPRVRLVTITDLKLSRDLTVAKIYFTSLNDEDDLDEIAQVLNRASGFIRSVVGRETRLRTTPELRFFKDDAALRGREMNRLIDSAMSMEQAKASTDSVDDAAESDAGEEAQKSSKSDDFSGRE